MTTLKTTARETTVVKVSKQFSLALRAVVFFFSEITRVKGTVKLCKLEKTNGRFKLRRRKRLLRV